MMETVEIIACSIGLMAGLTWFQPFALFSLARMIERGAENVVWGLRIRAISYRDGEIARKRSKEFYGSPKLKSGVRVKAREENSALIYAPRLEDFR